MSSFSLFFPSPPSAADFFLLELFLLTGMASPLLAGCVSLLSAAAVGVASFEASVGLPVEVLGSC